MGQRQRHDGPGVVHHAMNRGIGKRLLFADRVDYRQFLAQLACATRRGELLVLAYALLGTHFHLLVRTCEGTLAQALGRVQNGYCRWFNRRNRRDGPLFRGRFRSKPVDSPEYFEAVLRYIDSNATSAGLCARAEAYPWGSARHYASGRLPPWLYAEAVWSWIDTYRGAQEARAACYARFCGAAQPEEASDWVRAQIEGEAAADQRLELSVRAPSDQVLAWMRRKALVADGHRPVRAVASPLAIQRALSELRGGLELAPVRLSRKAIDPWSTLEAGLMATMAGQSQQCVAERLGIAQSTASVQVRRHRELLGRDEAYARAAARIATRAIELTFPKSR